jgi:hypothetical protein
LKTLEWWPQQPHHLLDRGEDGVLAAGDTFEVSDEEAEDALTEPGTELRLAVDPSERELAGGDAQQSGSGDDDGTDDDDDDDSSDLGDA